MITYSAIIRNYRQLKSVEGWLLEDAAGLMAFLDMVQKQQHITGDFFEIGVHHGLSTAFMAGLLRPKESIHVCDLFNQQDKNISASGQGDFAIFSQTMERFAPNRLGEVYTMPSSALSAASLPATIRFFHIDGGHSPDEVMQDIQLAATATLPEGIILIDDPFNDPWPGVTEGIFRFLAMQQEWVPLVLGFNKLALVHIDHSQPYIQALDDPALQRAYRLDYPIRYKRSMLFGHPLRVFNVPAHLMYKHRSPWIMLKRKLRQSSWVREWRNRVLGR